VGVVQSTVTGSGNIAAGTDVNVNFNTSGTLESVDVSAGQHVSPGQLLATLDPTAAQLSLDQANQNLTAAQDNLSCLDGGSTNCGSGGGSGSGAGSGTSSGSGSTTGASYTRGTATTVFAAYKPGGISGTDAKAGSGTGSNTTTVTTTTTTTTPAGPTTTSPPSSSGTGGRGSGSGGSGGSRGSSGSSGSSSGSGRSGSSSSGSGRSGGSSASGSGGSGSGAKASTTATTTTPSPSSIASAQAAVYSAEAAVHNAQVALNNTKLYAPVSGTIASLSSLIPGDSVSGGASGNASSGGSSSGSSGSGSGAGTAAGSLGGSGGSSSSSGSSSAFVEIVNTSALSMTVAFSESDISKVNVGQPATVTLDALPGVELAAHISQISLVGTTSSSVVSYNATLTLDQNDSRVKPGMSASAAVIVGQAQGVTVPNQAITGSGSLATVNLL
jgi:membrane fusion protein, macrolide-specific efflux system